MHKNQLTFPKSLKCNQRLAFSSQNPGGSEAAEATPYTQAS